MEKRTLGYFRIAILTLGCLGASPALAAVYNGGPMTMEQPDGSQVDVRLFGDQLYIRGEGVDGFTVIRDHGTGVICYAALNADSSEWVSTGQVYHGKVAGDATGRTGFSALRAAAAPASASASAALVSRGIAPGLDLKLEARSRIRARTARELGLDAASGGAPHESAGPAPLGKTASTMLSSATSAEDPVKKVTGVIVLVEFPDVRATFTKEQIGDMANLKGFNVNGNNGSIRDYFLDVSQGKFEYDLVVTEYYMARNNKAHYDRADGYAGGQELIKEALQGLDARGYDFSKLTTSSTGMVSSVNVLFAGASGKVWTQGLWANRGFIPTLNFDGVKVSGYMLAYIGTALTIGTFVHESGHQLFGWPDYYDYDSDSRGTGAYCLMSGQHAKNPQPPNAYLRARQGWEPALDLRAASDAQVTVPSNGRAIYRYANPGNAREYFLIENIARKDRWANMPDEGLMIWHVDEAGNNSWQEGTASRHYQVSVEQADGKFELERDVNGGGANDLFHAGNNASFTANTAPDSRWWNGLESGLNIINISAVKDTMTFQMQGLALSLADCPGKNGVPGRMGGPWKDGYVWRMDGRRVKMPAGSGLAAAEKAFQESPSKARIPD